MGKTTQLINIEFNNQPISVIENDDNRYVALRHIVEGIGLNWKSQHKKLTENGEKFNCGDITTVAADGKPRIMLCIPFEKLNGYLFSINAEKVNPDIKNKVILYQEKCFVALHDYFNKGYSLNKEILQQSPSKRDQLSAQLRQLRIEDKDLYQKLRDAIAATCTDYQSKDGREIGSFFAAIQDSFHFAVSGYTAAELVYYNIDSTKPNLGMISYSGTKKTFSLVEINTGKNFLDKKSFRKFEILYDQLLSFVEMKVLNGDEMTLAKWTHQLNSIIIANGLNPFPGYENRITRKQSDPKAATEHKKYKQLMLK